LEILEVVDGHRLAHDRTRLAEMSYAELSASMARRAVHRLGTDGWPDRNIFEHHDTGPASWMCKPIIQSPSSLTKWTSPSSAQASSAFTRLTPFSTTDMPSR